MKAPTLAFLAAVLVAACSRETSTASDSASASDAANTTTVLTGRLAASPPMASPQPKAVMGLAAGVTTSEFSGSMRDQSSAEASASGDPLQNINAMTSGAPAMVIRTGQAFVEVEKLDPAVLKIRQLVAQVGGYVANSSMSGGRDQIRQASIEIKLPSAKYDEAVSSLSAIGKVETVNSNAQDVGEEYVDITARVTNARRLEERLINLLANRTGKLDEVLRVERELARVREEIERYEGRLRYLSARASMSTLVINAHEPAPLIGNQPGENPIGAAVRRAWDNFVSLLAALIASLGILIPLGALAGGGLIGYRRWKRTHVSA
jgi:uncharacterized protein DUF4349